VQKLIALGLAIALALISYFLVEKPLRSAPWLRAPVRAIPASLLAIVLLAWGADRMFANASHFSASTVMANRSDWYPEVRTRGVTGCRVEWRSTGAALVSQPLDCGGPEANTRLFVIGDSHATAYLALLADYARLTRRPV